MTRKIKIEDATEIFCNAIFSEKEIVTKAIKTNDYKLLKRSFSNNENEDIRDSSEFITDFIFYIPDDILEAFEKEDKEDDIREEMWYYIQSALEDGIPE